MGHIRSLFDPQGRKKWVRDTFRFEFKGDAEKAFMHLCPSKTNGRPWSIVLKPPMFQLVEKKGFADKITSRYCLLYAPLMTSLTRDAHYYGPISK